MKFLQILFFFLTWFSTCATPLLLKVTLPSFEVSFPKIENQKLESEVKIGVENFARSGIPAKGRAQLEKSFSQKAVLQERYVSENRAREGNVKVVNTAGSLVRGINKTQFFETVAEFKLPANGLLGDQAWDLWKAKKWGELEDLFKTNNINGKWPPNRGFIEFTTEPLTVGKEIDRYGGYIDPSDGLFKDNGLYASPKGASFESRALPAEYLTSTPPKPYNKYRVIKEIPNVKQGQAAPWFNQPGMGTQYELPLSIDKLLSEGFIIKIN